MTRRRLGCSSSARSTTWLTPAEYVAALRIGIDQDTCTKWCLTGSVLQSRSRAPGRFQSFTYINMNWAKPSYLCHRPRSWCLENLARTFHKEHTSQLRPPAPGFLQEPSSRPDFNQIEARLASMGTVHGSMQEVHRARQQDRQLLDQMLPPKVTAVREGKTSHFWLCNAWPWAVQQQVWQPGVLADTGWLAVLAQPIWPLVCRCEWGCFC